MSQFQSQVKEQRNHNAEIFQAWQICWLWLQFGLTCAQIWRHVQKAFKHIIHALSIRNLAPRGTIHRYDITTITNLRSMAPLWIDFRSSTTACKRTAFRQKSSCIACKIRRLAQQKMTHGCSVSKQSKSTEWCPKFSLPLHRSQKKVNTNSQAKNSEIPCCTREKR